MGAVRVCEGQSQAGPHRMFKLSSRFSRFVLLCSVDRGGFVHRSALILSPPLAQDLRQAEIETHAKKLLPRCR
jgi:hypothetical protein